MLGIQPLGWRRKCSGSLGAGAAGEYGLPWAERLEARRAAANWRRSMGVTARGRSLRA